VPVIAQRSGISVLLLAVPLALGCGHDERLTPPDGAATVGFDEQATTELRAVGVDKYFGQFEPEKVQSYDNVDVYTFAPRDDGPTCLYGSPFRVSVRDMGSKDTIIYLQGGGACWSALCAANEDASMGVQPIGWTDESAERNPPLAGFNVVFVAYCDGSVFSGDNVITGKDGKVERRHRGLANLSAALDIAKKRFPSPRQLVLSGSSAGGYGTILGTAVVRLAYPDTPLLVLNDAGPGVTNPADDSLMKGATEEWKAMQFVPASCEGCIASGQFTGVVKWGLDHDPSLRVSTFCAREDFVISNVFLKMTGAEFEKVLLEETGKVHDAHPDRFKRYFWQGAAHTAILAGYYDLEIDGTKLIDFVQAALDQKPEWRDLIE